jgi:hypothetical protein
MAGKPIISFDLDGVLVGGNYIPEWDRKPEIYRSLPAANPNAYEVLWELANKFQIYYVSSRCFDSALQVSYEWLFDNGFPLGPGGVIVGQRNKPEMLRLLGVSVHFDDDPRVVLAYPSVGVLCAFPGCSWQYFNNQYGPPVGDLLADPSVRSIRSFAEVPLILGVSGPVQLPLPFVA